MTEAGTPVLPFCPTSIQIRDGCLLASSPMSHGRMKIFRGCSELLEKHQEGGGVCDSACLCVRSRMCIYEVGEEEGELGG